MRQEIEKYEGWNHDIMVAISKAESSVDINLNGRFDPDEFCYRQARGDTTLTYQNNGRVYGYSVGVFQVRILEGREHCDTYDIEVNVKCAYNVWKGQGYGAWSVYTNGKYLRV